MKLIIVESPTKAKTISKFIGSGYKVESSFGHIRDLPKSKMGIDIDNNFEPKYVIPTKAKKNVTNLKKIAEKAEEIILASDEDREGEAIAWHLSQILKIKPEQAKRIVFHEITEKAITEALKNPRHINIALADSQQARRVLDRLVGYELSPFLWKKVAKGLSAGRVQSVAVRLIVAREREIQNFKAEEYWTIKGNFKKEKNSLEAELNKINGQTLKKLDIQNQKKAEEYKKEANKQKYFVLDIEKKQNKKNPPKPFTTSSLQQTANRWLGFSAKQTMVIAQQLYEGVNIKGQGHLGLITYMRTDSLNLSETFLSSAQEYLQKNLGQNYVLPQARKYKTKSKGAQEAHEAIRPADVWQDPEKIKNSLNNNQYKLYKLIWQRSLASQMPEAIVDSTGLDIADEEKKYNFRATGQIINFPGYLKIYPEKSQEKELPELQVGDQINLQKIETEQHFTKPPARYSDAGLVKTLEKHGIGRPSTYAPTIATITARNYVNRDEHKKLQPTEIAFIVSDLLEKHFPKIVDYDFTADLENNLDKIAEGKIEWQPVIKNFYEPFHKNLEEKTMEIKKEDIMPEEKTDEKCEKCGSPMVIKSGRYGKFLACSNYPECKNSRPLTTPEEDKELQELQKKYANEKCEKCGSPMVIKSGRYGKFLACSNYPKCKNIKSLQEKKKTGIKCPVCGQGEIVEKMSRRGKFYACDQYPKCKTAFSYKPINKKCPECGSLLVETPQGKIKCSNKSCNYVE